MVDPYLIPESRVAPEYPPAALRAGLDATVTVAAQVLPDGTVGDVETLDCTRPNLGFERATELAVQQWRFEPARQDGVAFESYSVVRLSYRTQSGRGGGGSGFVAVQFGQPVVVAPPAAPLASSGNSTTQIGAISLDGLFRGVSHPRIPRCGGLRCAYNVGDIWPNAEPGGAMPDAGFHIEPGH